MKYLLAIALLLSGCAPKAIIVEPIAPAVARAAAASKAASAGAKIVQTKTTALHEQAKGIAAEADRMKAETDRLWNLPGVPLAEFDALWIMANDLQKETFAHEIQARETVAAANDGEKLAAAAEQSTAEVVPLAKKQDTAVADLKTQAVKRADDASLGRALKGVFWMGGIVLVIGGTILAILKFKPGIL
jgi:hypothetical protein